MLQLQDIVVGYGDSTVLHELSLEVAAGDVVALMGRNGMGKTTLLRTIMGLLTPRAGRIRFRDHDIAGLPSHTIARLGLGYVPQGREVFQDFSVAENLRLGLIGQRGPAARTVPAEIYDWFPVLAERRSQRAGTLSGGQQQMLAIGRALVAAPTLLLLDEPSEGIQPSIVAEIADVLRTIVTERGLTVLIVEQNADMATGLADDVAFIENGRIAERVTAAALRSDDSLIARRLSL